MINALGTCCATEWCVDAGGRIVMVVNHAQGDKRACMLSESDAPFAENKNTNGLS